MPTKPLRIWWPNVFHGVLFLAAFLWWAFWIHIGRDFTGRWYYLWIALDVPFNLAWPVFGYGAILKWVPREPVGGVGGTTKQEETR